MQRLRDDAGKLQVELVFWHATRAVGAGRHGRVAYIDDHTKCRLPQDPLDDRRGRDPFNPDQ